MKSSPVTLLRLLLLVLPLLGGTSWARQFAWNSLVGAGGSGSAEVVAIRAPRQAGDSPPAFTAVNLNGAIELPGLPLLDSLTAPTAAVLRYSDDASGHRTKLDWSATIRSVGGVKITGLATAGPSGEVFVCGVSEGPPVFGGLVLPIGPKDPRGFVARLDPAAGVWLGHFITEGILPTGVAFGANQVFVTGGGCLCAAYSAGGMPRWTACLPAGCAPASHIDLGPGGIHALAKSTEGEGSLMVSRLSPLNGATIRSFRVEGSAACQPAGLRVGTDGAIWVAGNRPPGSDPVRGFLTRISREGATEWKSTLGTPDTAAEMVVGSFDLDEEGNAWVGAKLNGRWVFPDLDAQAFMQDVALMAVDQAGKVFDFQRGTGDGHESATAVCAVSPGMAILGGSCSGGLLSLGGLSPLVPGSGGSMFLSSVRKAAGLSHWVFRNDPGSPHLLDLPVLRHLLRALGISLYLDVNNGPLGSAVTGYATPEQITLLRAIGGVVAEPEIEVRPNAADRGWALARMADGSNKATPQDKVDYESVATTRGVRLYLIDTAVKHVANWFSANDKLANDGTVLMRGAGDPTVSSKFEHGTRMLSLIAGPETGVATRTPIRMLNYDIYPNGNSTSGLLASAILEAVDHHQEEEPNEPAAICLASNSSVPADSTIVRMALQSAVEAGIAVIVSAGNEGKVAASYLPSRYGTMEGVICVGASGTSNERVSFSNHGSAVDVFAPGDRVRSLRYADPQKGTYDLINGTSASAAYTSAAAILLLSLDPTLSPSSLENTLKSSAYAGPVTLLQLAHTVADVSKELSLPEDHDGDGDGIPDIIERFHGSSLADADSRPAPIALRPEGGSVAAQFTVASELFVTSTPYQLADGTHWKVMVSEDLKTWRVAEGSLTTSPGSNGRVVVRFTFAKSGERGFVKIEVTPPQEI
ncbi:MAG TPA: S8 family serine peptidase [Haloferula sp.]